MKINFTKKEYRSLVNALDIADWVINSHQNGSDEGPQEFAELLQKIYAISKQMGCEDLVEFNESDGKYYPTRELEDNSESRVYIDEYDRETFWFELVSRLANRDVLGKFNVDSFADISVEERISAICEAESKWDNEFASHGLERICVKSNLLTN